jgi:adenylate kinase
MPLIAFWTVFACARAALAKGWELTTKVSSPDAKQFIVMNEKNDRAAWLKGGESQCAVLPLANPNPARLILLGAPGVGKGTQAELLSARLRTCHLSTGDVFRAAKCLGEGERTPALESALGNMKRGELVPDETVLSMVAERVRCLRCHGGILLDGFPRTVAQAEALEALLKTQNIALTAVLNYDLPIDQIVARLSGRRTCSGCKAVFHVSTLPPKVAGICDHCGKPLLQREDDRPESVRVRMEAYQKSTTPLIQFYQSRGLLVNVPANGTPQEICDRSLASLVTRLEPDPIMRPPKPRSTRPGRKPKTVK